MNRTSRNGTSPDERTRHSVGGARRAALAAGAFLVAVLGLPGIAAAERSKSPEPPDLDEPKQTRVVNGSSASIGDFPWYVALLNPSEPDYYQAQFCGGTVVAPKLVITAAHCVVDRDEVDVLHGTDMLDGSGTRVPSSNITVHPAYDDNSVQNDIAVVHLSSSIPTADVTIAGHDNANYWASGDVARVAGFGCTDWSVGGGGCLSYPYDLWKASVTVRTTGTCSSYYGGDFDPQTMLCAGNTSVTGSAPDSCAGDSGGPLTVTGPGGDPILVGVVSWGYACGVLPGVYSRVSTFEPWLAQFGLGDAGGGYWLSASDGGMFTFGDAEYYGSTGDIDLNLPIVTMAPTPTRQGYWLAAMDGGMFTFGDAEFYGSTGDMILNSPIVDMAATPAGDGYWLTAADGGIFTFGDAPFEGSTGGMTLNLPIVTFAPTPSGYGYWLAAGDGGIFTFGNADFFGSTGAMALNSPIIDMAPTPDGEGYWLCAADGGVFTFGNAGYHGSTGAIALNLPIVDFTPTPTGDGYWLTAMDGGVFAYGDAGYFGSTGAIALNQPIVTAASA